MCIWFILSNNRLLLQFRDEIIEIEELSLQFDLPLLIQPEEADAFQEENISGLGDETYPPFDSRFITTHLDVQ